MNLAWHRCAWPLLLSTVLLSSCGRDRSIACDEQAQRRAQQFITQVLQQEANGLRLRELGTTGRRVFYANVAASVAEERQSERIYIRNGFNVEEASCASELRDDAGRVVGQQINVRVHFPAGIWFDRQTYGEALATEHLYALRLDERFKIIGPLSQPFVSGRTALSLLGTEPYTAAALLELRKQLAEGPGREPPQ